MTEGGAIQSAVARCTDPNVICDTRDVVSFHLHIFAFFNYCMLSFSHFFITLITLSVF